MAAHIDESQIRATLGALADFMCASNTHPVGEAREFALLTSTQVEHDWEQGKARFEKLMNEVARAATRSVPTTQASTQGNTHAQSLATAPGNGIVVADIATAMEASTNGANSVNSVNIADPHKKFKNALEDSLESAYVAIDRIFRKDLASIYTTRHVKAPSPLSLKKDRLDEVPKPQLAFDTPIDNSDTPFIPPHTEKYIPHSEAHPMEDRIMQALAEAKKLPITTPIVFDALDDKYPFLWVDTTEALRTMTSELSVESVIAVDLEHHNKRTFMGLTCLIQISTRTKDFVIDTLKLRSQVHGALAPIFHNVGIVKIFHGATSDVTWLERDFGLYVVNMFDTYCACKALNLSGESLSFLLLQFCDVPSNNKKSMQMEDWRKRPLSKEMLKYARADTHYLLYIYDRLRQEASKKKLLENVLDMSAKVSRFRYVKPSPKPKYSVNAALKRGFDNRGVHVLYNLHMWRDRIAREHDESTGYVLSNERCLKVVSTMPNTAEKLRLALRPWQLPPFLSKPGIMNSLLEVTKQAKNDTINTEWAIEVDKIRSRKQERRKKAAEARAAAAAAAANPEADAENKDKATDASEEDATSSCSTTTTDTTTHAIDALSNARRTATRLSAMKKSSALCFDSESESSSLGSVAERLLLDATKQTSRPTTVMAAKKPSFKFGDSDAESSSDMAPNSSPVMIETSKVHPVLAASSALFDLSDSDGNENRSNGVTKSNVEVQDSGLVTGNGSATVQTVLVTGPEEPTDSDPIQGSVSKSAKSLEVPAISKSVFNLEDSEDESISNPASAADKVRDEIASEARTSAQGMNFDLPEAEDVGTEVEESVSVKDVVKDEKEEEAKPLVMQKSTRRRKQKKLEKKEAPPLPPFDYAAAAAENTDAKKSKKTEKPFNPNNVQRDSSRRVRRTRKNPGSGSRSMTFTANT